MKKPTRNKHRAQDAPRPPFPEACAEEALSLVAGWGGGIEAAIRNTTPQAISRSRVRDRCGPRGAAEGDLPAAFIVPAASGLACCKLKTLPTGDGELSTHAGKALIVPAHMFAGGSSSPPGAAW